jgi:hypothetical protein
VGHYPILTHEELIRRIKRRDRHVDDPQLSDCPMPAAARLSRRRASFDAR